MENECKIGRNAGFYENILKETCREVECVDMDLSRLVGKYDLGLQRKVRNALVAYLNCEGDTRYHPAMILILIQFGLGFDSEEIMFLMFRELMNKYHWKEILG